MTQNNQEELALQENEVENESDSEASQENSEVTETTDTETTAESTNSQEKAEKKYVSKKDYRDMYEKSLKSYEELRKLNDRRYQESLKIQKELQSKVDRWSPYEKLLKEAVEAKRQSELKQLAESNPAEYQKKLIEMAKEEFLEAQAQKTQPEQAEQSLAPLSDEQALQVRDYLQNNYPKEVFEFARPQMAQLMTQIESENPAAARQLERNPDALMAMVVGQAYLREVAEKMQQKQIGTQNQQKAVKFATGTATPTAPARKNVNPNGDYNKMTDEQLREAAYAELSKRYNS